MNQFLDAVLDLDIRNDAGETFYNRGVLYHRQKKVELVTLNDEDAVFHVKGSWPEPYQVDITLEEWGIDYDCECPAFFDNGICKHLVAATLFLKELALSKQGVTKGEKRPTVGPIITHRWRKKLQESVSRAKIRRSYAASSKVNTHAYILIFSLIEDRYDQLELRGYKLPASQLPATLFDKSNQTLSGSLAELRSYLDENRYELRKKVKEISSQTRLDPRKCLNFPPYFIQIIKMTADNYNYYHYKFGEHLQDILDADGHLYSGSEKEPLSQNLTVAKEPVHLKLNILRQEKTIHFDAELIIGQDRLDMPHELTLIGENSLWLLHENKQLLEFDKSVDLSSFGLVKELSDLIIPADEIEFFTSNILPPLMELVSISGDFIEWEDITDPDPKPELYLIQADESSPLIVDLNFKYEDTVVPYAESSQTITIVRVPESEENPGTARYQRVHRNKEWESAVYGGLSGTRTGLKRSPQNNPDSEFLLRSNVDPVDFLLKKIPKLLEDGFTVYGEETLKSAKVNRNKPSISLRVSSGIDWFDLQAVVQFGDTAASLPAIRQAVRKKERYIKLADGSIGEIPDEWIKKYKHLFTLGAQHGDDIRFDAHHLSLIDLLLTEAQSAETDQQFQHKLDAMRSFSGVKSVPLPASFNGTLRPYQKAGFDWLHFL